MAIQTFIAVEFYFFTACWVEVWVVARRAGHVGYGALITGAGVHLFDMTQDWSRLVALDQTSLNFIPGRKSKKDFP